MAVTFHNLTVDPYTITGAVPGSDVAVKVRTNTGGAIIDAAANKIFLGNYRVNTKTAVAISLPATNGATNPTAFQYAVELEWADPVTRDRARWDSGWFSLTASADLADVAAEQYVPPTWMTTAVTTLQGYVTQGETVRDETQAIRDGIVGDLGTTDSQTATLVNGPSLTSAALAASTADAISPGATDPQTAVDERIGLGASNLTAVSEAAATAVDTELTNAGVLYAAAAPPISTNRVLDPQMKVGGEAYDGTLYPVTHLTTGLPAGYAYGMKTTRAGTASSVISQAFLSPRLSNTGLRIPVTPGETITVMALVQTSVSSAQARMDAYFWNSSGGSSGVATNGFTGTYTALPAGTAQWRSITVTVPTGAVFVTPRPTVSKTSGNAATGDEVIYTAVMVVAGSTVPTYGDGTSEGWAWTGTAHASTSKQVFQNSTQAAVTLALPGRVTTVEANAGHLTVVKSGNDVTISRAFDSTTITETLKMNGSANGLFTFYQALVGGTYLKDCSDDITPIRLTDGSTVGGNHITAGYSIVNAITTLRVDGRRTTTDGTWSAREVSVHESYEIANGSAVSLIRVNNVYRWTGGICRVTTILDELVSTGLGVCGSVQGVIPTMVGATITRYVPGAQTAANNWKAGIDMTSYSVTDFILPADMASGQPPTMSIDRVKIGGTDQAAFVVGYVPDGARGDEASVNSKRLTKAATNLWEIRGANKKSYPTWTTAEAGGWGRLRTDSFRAYVAPSNIPTLLTAAATPNAAWDALATLSAA